MRRRQFVPNALSSSCLTTRRATRKPPVRLALRTSLKSSSLMRSTRPSRVIPALLTRISTGPKDSSISVTAASTESLSVTSHFTTNRPSRSSPVPERGSDGDLISAGLKAFGGGEPDSSVASGNEDNPDSPAHHQSCPGHARAKTGHQHDLAGLQPLLGTRACSMANGMEAVEVLPVVSITL